MKKFILSTVVILTFIIYSLNQNVGGGVSATSKNTNNPTVETVNGVSFSPVLPATSTVSTKSKPVVSIPSLPVSPRYKGDDYENDSENYRYSQNSVVSTPAPVTTPVPVIPTPVTPAPVAVGNGKYRNGTYTGSNEYAYSDYIQVSAVISGGKLTDVQFPSSTGGPGRSVQIYSYAMPQLKSEAISAQSANIDTVSGATYTSSAFQQSLASALTQAIN